MSVWCFFSIFIIVNNNFLNCLERLLFKIVDGVIWKEKQHSKNYLTNSSEYYVRQVR